MDFPGDGSLDNYNVGTELMLNLGTVLKSSGTATNTIDVPFTNRGLVDVQLGAVNLTDTYDLASGRLTCGLNGAGSNGQRLLAGKASLKVVFSANLNNGYVPVNGDTFNVVRFGSSVGLCSAVALPSGLTWQTNYNATAFTNKITRSAVATGFPIALDRVAGLPRLSWTNNPGERFQAQYRDDLSAGVWNNVGPILVPTGTTTDITDSSAAGVPTQFYRVEQLP